VHTVIADVSQEEDCKAIVEKAVEEFEGVDILILNAAYTEAIPMWFTEDKKPVRIRLVNYLKVQSLRDLLEDAVGPSHLNCSWYNLNCSPAKKVFSIQFVTSHPSAVRERLVMRLQESITL